MLKNKRLILMIFLLFGMLFFVELVSADAWINPRFEYVNENLSGFLDISDLSSAWFLVESSYEIPTIFMGLNDTSFFNLSLVFMDYSPAGAFYYIAQPSDIVLPGFGSYAFNLSIVKNTGKVYEETLWTIDVIQNQEVCQVLFNETSPAVEPATVKVYTNCSSAFVLSKNGTTIENGSTQTLSAGAYNFSFIRNDTVNYSCIYNESEFRVLQDIFSPTYSSNSVNDTIAGNIVQFAIYLTDDLLNPNGQYTFSTNNTGEWINDSAVNFTATPSWANVTKTLNSTVGTIVGYRWFFNDSAGNLNSTEIYTLTTMWGDNGSLIQEVSGCNSLTTTGATYTLISDITSTGTCFNISAQNITLDCAGNTITYSTNGSNNFYGIYTNQFNATIKNCNILDGNWSSSQTSRYGIYFNSANNSIILNSSVNTSNSSPGYLTSVNFNNITSSVFNSNSRYGLYLSSGSKNNVLSNITAISNESSGLYLSSSSNNTLSNINATSNGGAGLGISSSSNNNTLSNITATSNTSSGLSISSSSNNNTLSNITATSNGGTGLGISFSSNNNTLSNIIATSNTNNGLSLSSSSNNTLSNITATSDEEAGLFFMDSSNNTLSNITASSNTGSGLSLTVGSNDNIFSDITSNSNESYGTYSSSSSNNTLSNLTTSSNISYGIYFSSSSKNVLSNITASSNEGYGLYLASNSNNNVFSDINTNSINSRGLYLSSSSNNTLSNLITSSNEGNGLTLSGSRDNLLSNITATSLNEAGIYFTNALNNTLSNVTASSNTSIALFFYISSNNTVSNAILTSLDYGSGIMTYESDDNILSNITTSSNGGYGIYLFSSSNNNTLSNITASSNLSVAFDLGSDSDFNSISNSTFLSLYKNTTLVFLGSDCNSNTFYWNNFTETSGYYVQDLNGANYYNTTIDEVGEGNIWEDVMNGSVIIEGDTLSSGYSSLYIGESGANYPYNSTNSFGKLSGNIVDYAPLFIVLIDTIPPSLSTIPANASLFYGNPSLLVNFTGADETSSYVNYSLNDTRFTINQTGALSNATPLAVGNYAINVTINDSSNNINWTIYRVQINKSNEDCQVLFDTSSPVTYPGTFSVFTNCSTASVLYRNGVEIQNNSEQSLGAGTYNFSFQRTDSSNYSINYNETTFTIVAAEVIASNAGGGSSSNPNSPKTYTADETVISSPQGETFELKPLDKVSFKVSESTHTATLNLYTPTTARVTIRSTSLVVVLEKGILRELDLNSDLINDLAIRYDGLIDGKVSLFMREILPISEDLTSDDLDSEQGPQQEDSTENSTEEKEKFKFNLLGFQKVTLIVSIAFLIIVGSAIFYFIRKKKRNY